MTRQRHVGAISISRLSSSGEVLVRVEDQASWTTVLELTLSVEEFGLAVTGVSYRPCTFAVDAARVGLRREHNQELVFVPDGPYAERASRAATAVHARERDGWIGRVGDATNGHNVTRTDAMLLGDALVTGDWYTVVFERWVPIPEMAAAEQSS